MGLATPVAMPESAITCDGCYFRREALCALQDGPCPTFRPYVEEQTSVPPPPPLIIAPAHASAVAV
ncbi:MAG: hypothetical protein OXG37_07890 [Actinomycetia bacterium]|nr:hypothetical protein [Actinomycetes bacterium]